MPSPRSCWVLLVPCYLLSASLLAGAEPGLRVPPGFVVQRVAAPPLVEHPTMAGFDDQGRLYVCDGPGMNLPAKELLDKLPNKIRRLEDTDGDGIFDRSTIFADQMTFPMGALWYQGALYTASPPHIWRLRDTTGDGVADERTILVSEFGFTGNAADIHGCFLHPDGRLFWCDGRHGHNFVDEQGRQISKGLAARLFSCRLDGSRVEAFAGGGMDNPVEVAFTPTGEPLGTVAIYDVVDGRHDALIHWVYGGAYPRHEQKCLDEFKRTGDLLPTVSRWGQVAPSGTTAYRGSQFGAQGRDAHFSAHFNTHTVVRSRLRPEGATYAAEDDDFLTSDDLDFHPTDVLEDADGSLLVIDTGGWFRIGCPTSQIAKPEILGGIYRIRRVDAPPLVDPRGLQLTWEHPAPADLVARLGDARPAVRDRAMSALHARGDEGVPLLADRLISPRATLDEQSLILWTLARIDTPAARAALRGALSARPQRLKQIAAQALGTLRDIESFEPLCSLVIEESSPVRREAATALGRIGNRGAVPALLAAASVADDRFIEHAVAFALIQLADRDTTLRGLQSPLPRVQRLALIALDQMDDGQLTREQVTPLLETDDFALQRTVLEIITRRGWGAEVLPLLARWLVEPEPSTARLAMLDRALLALARDAETHAVVAAALNNAATSTAARGVLLEWFVQSGLSELDEPLAAALAAQLDRPEVARPTIATLAALNLPRFDAPLAALADRPGTTQPLRIAALVVLARRGHPLTDDAFQLLRAECRTADDPIDRLAAAEALGRAGLSLPQRTELVSALAGAGPLELPPLLRVFEQPECAPLGPAVLAALDKSPGLDNLGVDRLAKLVAGYPDDVRPLAQPLLRRFTTDLTAQRSRLDELLPQLEGGDPARGRSVFLNGKGACVACHKARGQGNLIGPELSTIGKIRSRIDLLESLIFPSASLARGYETYSLITTGGQAHVGILARDTPEALFLWTPQRQLVRVARSEIDELAPNPVSIMPQGFDKLLSPAELRDLLAYLESLK